MKAFFCISWSPRRFYPTDRIFETIEGFFTAIATNFDIGSGILTTNKARSAFLADSASVWAKVK
jgi:hypothetical protein